MTPLDFFHLEGTSRIPTIFQHTDEQLNVAIERAVQQCPDFFVLLHGIDAYMERRRRRIKLQCERREERMHREWLMQKSIDNMWGNS